MVLQAERSSLSHGWCWSNWADFSPSLGCVSLEKCARVCARSWGDKHTERLAITLRLPSVAAPWGRSDARAPVCPGLGRPGGLVGRLVKTPRRENLGTWTRGSDRVLPSPHGWAPGARTHPPAAAKAPVGCWERRTPLVNDSVQKPTPRLSLPSPDTDLKQRGWEVCPC